MRRTDPTRWLRVLALTADDHTTRQIAAELNWCLRTIENDLVYARRILGVRSIPAAVAAAIRTGLI